MRVVFRILYLILVIFLILTAHIFVVNFLPEPFSRINIIFSTSFLLLTAIGNKKTFWLALVLSYFSELFSGAPFGIGIISLLLSLLAINWFQFNILTNHSSLMVVLSAVLGIILYRILFILFLTVNNYLVSSALLPHKEIIADTFWEILLTSVFIFFAYLLGWKFLKRLRLAKIKNKNIYG